MNPLSRLVAAVLLVSFVAACAGKRPEEKQMVSNDTVTHVVIMYLYNRGDLTARSQVIDAVGQLRTIEDVQSAWAGHMLSSGRPVVDQSYDVAYVMNFKSEDALNRYINNPTHQRVKKDILDRYVRKYVVYDFVTEK